MVIEINKPDYWAQGLSLLGTILGKNAQNAEFNKGIAKLAEIKANSDAINKAGTDYAGTQDWFSTANQIKDYNKQWADLDAAGIPADDPRRLNIIQQSNTIRDLAAKKGYNVPGQDVSYGNIQGWIDNEANNRIAKIAETLNNGGYSNANQYVRPSDMGRDAGATARPAFDVNASLSGIGNIIKNAQSQAADPITYQTGLARLNLDPEVMSRLAPIANAYTKNATDSEAARLLAVMTSPVSTQEEKIAAGFRINQLSGSKSGTEMLQGLTPEKKAVQFNTGGKQGYDVITMPSPLGTGEPSASNLVTRENTLAPRDVQSGQQFNQSLAQRDKEFIANFGLQQQKLQNDIANDAERIKLAGQNSALSGFGTLLTDLRGRAANALRGAQDIITSKKNSEYGYNPANDPAVQAYMQNYQKLTESADSISNQLAAAVGLEVPEQSQVPEPNVSRQKIAIPRSQYNSTFKNIKNKQPKASDDEIKKYMSNNYYFSD